HDSSANFSGAQTRCSFFSLIRNTRGNMPTYFVVGENRMTRFCVAACLVASLLLPGGMFAQQSPQLPVLKQEAAAEVDKLQTLTQQMVDEIFSYSELGFQEYETSRYVTGILEKNGFQVEHG